MNKELVQDVIDFYKSLDCTYIVLKVEDLAEGLSEEEYNLFQRIIQRYNTYRKLKGKKIDKHFVVNRDDYPQFKSAQEFYDFLNEQTQKEQNVETSN